MNSKVKAPQQKVRWSNHRWKAIQDEVVSLIRVNDALKSELRRKEEISRREWKDHLLKLLEVVDLFDRYFAGIEPKEKDADRQTKTWLGYFRTVRRSLETKLKEAGIARIDSPEGKASARTHVIVETRPSPGLEDDVILQELEKGYLWREGVLRAARVIVVKNT